MAGLVISIAWDLHRETENLTWFVVLSGHPISAMMVVIVKHSYQPVLPFESIGQC